MQIIGNGWTLRYALKGDNTAKAAEQAQASFTNELTQAFQTAFQGQSALISTLTNTLTPQVQNPTGFSPAAEAALRTNATDTIAGQYQNAEKALNTRQALSGGIDLPSGVNAMQQGALAAQAAGSESQAQNNITLANEQQKQANYWNAVSALSGTAQIENPNAFASNANQGAGEVAGLSKAVTDSQNSGFFNQLAGGLGKGLGSGLSGFLTGGFNNLGGILNGGGLFS